LFWLVFYVILRHNTGMDSKTLLRASAIGAAAVAYLAILIFHFDIFSLYTIFFIILGAAAGIAVAYKVRFS
jgi:uncharacterized membrane protein